MAKQTINIGTAPNDGTGTPLRTSFDYCNLNFTELYTAVGPSGNNIVVPGTATITGALTANGGIAMANASSITSGGAVALYVDTTVLTIRARATNGFRIQESTGVNNLLTISDAGVHAFLNGAGATRMTLNSSSNLVLAGGTAGANGVGLTFPATQSASSDANCLDDYEEGTWTPTLNSGTFSSASCRYTKIGNMVTIFFDVTVGTGGGNQITNLPFAANANSTVANGIYTNNQDYAAGTTAPVVVVGGSSSTLFFRTVGDNVAFSAMTLTAAANLTGSISYFV